MNKDSKIYVAGHNGLVGSAICKCLRAEGYSNIITRSHSELDLIDQVAVNSFFENEKPEYVFLAAAVVGGIVANSLYRGDFIYGNMMIQNNVIHAAYKNEVKKLLFLGSTCIYPKEAQQPIIEDCLLTSPLEYTNEPYAIAKIAGIKMCESYNLQYGTNFISVMPTNLYGPNDNFDLQKSHVLPALIRKLFLGRCLESNDWDNIYKDLKKYPIGDINESSSKAEIMSTLSNFGITQLTEDKVQIDIWGTGKPLREFLWSEEMASACVYIMQNVDFADVANGDEVRNTHINIGTGKDISIADLALLIKQKVGFEGNLFFDTSKPDGTMKKLTDTTKLNKLGWQHKIDIEEGVEKMIEWYSSSK